MRQVFFLFFFTGFLFSLRVNAQHPDSIQVKQPTDSVLEKKDSIYTGKNTTQAARDSIEKRMKRNYHRATLYSAILPGAGQVYNKKYWKVPIIYAALGISAYAFFYNKSWYNKCQYALTVTVNGTTNPDSLAEHRGSAIDTFCNFRRSKRTHYLPGQLQEKPRLFCSFFSFFLWSEYRGCHGGCTPERFQCEQRPEF